MNRAENWVALVAAGVRGMPGTVAGFILPFSIHGL